MTMLADGHPHAWDIDRAHEHLPDSFRNRRLADGGRLVVTSQMRQLAAGMPKWLRRGAAIAVSGPWGAGKTTVLQAVAAVADVNTAFVTLPGRARTEAAQWHYITTAITGTPASGTVRQMQNEAREYLTAVPTLLIVDEAQHLSTAALLQLRWLWDLAFPRFAIVLAGSDLFARLADEPSVDSRIDARIPIRELTSSRMVELLRLHHPMAAATDEHLLGQIDQAYAHGSWRAWSKLLLCLATDNGYTAPLDYETAATAILSITGTRPALHPAGPTRRPATGTCR
ncbi:AAA family ATPase [Phycicoccus sp. SLBN-51]|uniref:AAA family ATPase n=1 Tax=Phycicoccus sp. SLBN-51 TaxID=2768447 RepID=UPI001174EBED|nr:AAA family ATPase [Phycicoccus sp. SLBN-51]TQJ49274.1 type II secretory pathway predicted ATPase ExeA [Phycicoccus sp. SLBN-51]